MSEPLKPMNSEEFGKLSPDLLRQPFYARIALALRRGEEAMELAKEALDGLCEGDLWPNQDVPPGLPEEFREDNAQLRAEVERLQRDLNYERSTDFVDRDRWKEAEAKGEKLCAELARLRQENERLKTEMTEADESWGQDVEMAQTECDRLRSLIAAKDAALEMAARSLELAYSHIAAEKAREARRLS